MLIFNIDHYRPIQAQTLIEPSVLYDTMRERVAKDKIVR